MSIETISADRVARRSLILAALVCRGSIEHGAGQDIAESLHSRILEWVAALKLDDEIEVQERRIICAPLGSLDKKQVIDATWSVEGLVILVWALNIHSLPKHDKKVDPYEITDSLYFLSGDAVGLIHSAQLRPTGELQAFQELIYAVHCRLRDFTRYRLRKNFGNWIEQSWLDLLDVKSSQIIAKGDLAIDGKEISDVSEGNIEECDWISTQRHRAINWLLGDNPIYSKTLADT